MLPPTRYGCGTVLDPNQVCERHHKRQTWRMCFVTRLCLQIRVLCLRILLKHDIMDFFRHLHAQSVHPTSLAEIGIAADQLVSERPCKRQSMHVACPAAVMVAEYLIAALKARCQVSLLALGCMRNLTAVHASLLPTLLEAPQHHTILTALSSSKAERMQMP